MGYWTEVKLLYGGCILAQP